MFTNKCISILGLLKSYPKQIRCIQVSRKYKGINLNNETLLFCARPNFPQLINYRMSVSDSSTSMKIEENNSQEISLTPLPPHLEDLTENNSDIRKQIKMLLMEYEMHKLSGERMPSELTATHVTELLKMKGFMARKKYLNFRFLKELYPVIDKEKKEKKRLERLEQRKIVLEEQKDHIVYGLGNNTLFFRITSASMSNFYTNRQSKALLFGQSLVFDLGFQNEMVNRELINMIDQLQLAYAMNKINIEPFNLYFTNVDFGSSTYTSLQNAMPQINENTNMVTITDKSYIDLFPKNKLVYFTPDAPNSLKEYDHDAVYIIGAIVDKGGKLPLTMAKAKKEGIKMAKLPLDDHLFWAKSDKCLTLNQMISILLEAKRTESWKEALLSGVPKRKLKNYEEVKEADNHKQEKLRKSVYRSERREKQKNKTDSKFWKELMP